MRHRKAKKKLGMTTSHREATRRNMIVSLFRHERIVTTIEKAKGFRPFAEKLITLGKERTLSRYRRALSELQDKTIVKKLFTELATRYKDRPGGYTRILRLQKRRIGDNASQAILELVDNKVLEEKIARAETAEAAGESRGKKGDAHEHGHEHEHEHEEHEPGEHGHGEKDSGKHEHREEMKGGETHKPQQRGRTEQKKGAKRGGKRGS